MRRALYCLVALCCSVTVALAGPNAGGVLVVHDCSCIDTCDDPPPPPCPAPTSCAAVDNYIAPSSGPWPPRTWKVYAAFPTGSSPRLTSLAWGIDLLSAPYGMVYVTAAGLPDPPNMYEVVEGSWPTPSPGASIGESFVYPQTANLVECYWFAGYGYQGGEFATVPHATHESVFVDDTDQADPIEGFSTIGFGQPGTTVCPPPMGACCSGANCTIRSEAGCAVLGGVWQGESTGCLPNPCATGACCYPPYDLCIVVTQAECDSLGGIYFGDLTTCVPLPCPIRGACCFPTGECNLLYPGDCTDQGGDYQGDAHPCEPGLCLPPNPAERASWGRIKDLYR